MIYLACPYWHQDPEVRAARVEASRRIAASMAERGQMVFSPLVHGHHIGAGSEGYWREHGLEMLRRCNEVVIIAMDGWWESVGVRAEIAEAQRLGLPIRMILMTRLRSDGLTLSIRWPQSVGKQPPSSPRCSADRLQPTARWNTSGPEFDR